MWVQRVVIPFGRSDESAGVGAGLAVVGKEEPA